MGECKGELKVKERKHYQVMSLWLEEKEEEKKKKNELLMAKEVIVSHRDTGK